MTTPIIVPPDLTASLDQLHNLYGRNQPLLPIIQGLSTLARPRQLYGPGRSLPFVVSGLYDKLDELCRLYGSELAEDVLDDVIAWRKRFNRLVELQSKVTQILDTIWRTG
jgi:hypothetical protein